MAQKLPNPLPPPGSRPPPTPAPPAIMSDTAKRLTESMAAAARAFERLSAQIRETDPPPPKAAARLELAEAAIAAAINCRDDFLLGYTDYDNPRLAAFDDAVAEWRKAEESNP